jgi:hypothetical protein
VTRIGPTTGNVWWEDRRSLLDHQWDDAWWACLQWVSAAGLVASCFQWGWRSSLVAALTLAGLTALALLPFRLFTGPPDPIRLLDQAAVSGLALTGLGGIAALSMPLGLLVLIPLVATSPALRREVRAMGAILHWSHEASFDFRRDPTWAGPDADADADDGSWP